MLIIFANADLANAQPNPVISSVSPISATQLQTITIQGNGLGNAQPKLMNLRLGYSDTVGGGTTFIVHTREGRYAALEKQL